MSASSTAEPPQNDPPPAPSSDPAPRARKRRRRTMACTQCRSRKLRCDREYPICGRCQKSKTPAQCTYEDGFLWQQPNTVPATTVFSGAAIGGGPGPTIATSARNPLTSAASRPLDTDGFASNNAASNTNQNLTFPRVVADRSLCHTPDSGITSSWAPPRASASGTDAQREDKRDRFLETVLGAPKAAVNQEPVLQRHSHHHHHHSEGVGLSGYYHSPHHPNSHHYSGQYSQHHRYSPEDSDEDDMGRASPSQQLDVLPRIMMRGKETRTRFNGSSILADVMAQVGFLSCPRTFLSRLPSFADETVSRYKILCRRHPGVQSAHGPTSAGSRTGEKRSVEERAVGQTFSSPRCRGVDCVVALASGGGRPSRFVSDIHRIYASRPARTVVPP